jgi:hypothetical protein
MGLAFGGSEVQRGHLRIIPSPAIPSGNRPAVAPDAGLT